MRQALINSIQLCTHCKGITNNPPGDWSIIGELSLDLEPPLEAKIRVYFSTTNQTYVFVCDANEELAVLSIELIALYQTHFAQRLETSLLQIESTLLPKITKEKMVFFTGFGLGGNLAQLYAYCYDKHAIAIDSPGNKTLLEQKFESHQKEDVLSKRASHYMHIFSTRPNPINVYDKQLGTLYRIKIPLIEKTSWKHIGLSALDLLSVASNYFAIGSVFKVVNTGRLVSKAATEVALKEKAFEHITKITAEQAPSPVFSLFGGMPQPPIPYMTIPQALEQLELAKTALVAAKTTFASTTTRAALTATAAITLEVKEILNKISAAYQHSLVELAHQDDYSVIIMSSWPQTVIVPERGYGQFFLGMIWPERGLYIYDENAYLERTLVHSLPGYREGTENFSNAIIDFNERPSAGATTHTTIAEMRSEANSAPLFPEEIYEASSKVLTTSAFIKLLASLDFLPHFTTLCKLDLSNNCLDDGAADALALRPDRWQVLRLANNRLTYEGLKKLMVNVQGCLDNLDLAENRIFFSHTTLADQHLLTVPPSKTIRLDGNIVDLEAEVAADLNLADRAVRNERNSALIKCLRSRSLLFSSSETKFKSIIPDCHDTVSETQSLVFVIINNRSIDNQHAYLLIERLREGFPQVKELATYELLRAPEPHTNKAFVQYSRPNLREEGRFKKEVLGVRDSSKIRCYPMSRENEQRLVTNILTDVNKGIHFNYHKFAFRTSDAERQERINCAKWVADHLKAIDLNIDLGWFSSPTSLDEGRGWLRRLF